MSNWISVKDYLPEDRVDVLISIAGSHIPVAAQYFTSGQWVANTDHFTLPGDCQCDQKCIIDAFDASEVTHWKPLEPPHAD